MAYQLMAVGAGTVRSVAEPEPERERELRDVEIMRFTLSSGRKMLQAVAAGGYGNYAMSVAWCPIR